MQLMYCKKCGEVIQSWTKNTWVCTKHGMLSDRQVIATNDSGFFNWLRKHETKDRRKTR